ncbi:hypothetical protein [Priestia megaterium]|uniref:hypothetical protein n=1 Tax=Priestia megaterium TaxID=1404 RepID=UPI00387A7A90
MLGILLIIIAVVILFVIIMMNTRKSSNRNRKNAQSKEGNMNQSKNTDEQPVQYEKSPNVPSSPSQKKKTKVNKEDMSDDIYRKVLQQFAKGEQDPTSFMQKNHHAMNDDDFRKALKLMKKDNK